MASSMNKVPTKPTKRKPTERAFYEKPADKATSSDIINEARSSLRTLRTNRPHTPKDDRRTFFGERAAHERPPSSFRLVLLYVYICLFVLFFCHFKCIFNLNIGIPSKDKFEKPERG